MKRNIKLEGLAVILALFLFSCTDEAVEPDLSVTATPTTVAVGEPVTFSITGSAETFVIYPGDEGHQFEKSYIAITEGKVIDDESVVLSADSVPVIAEWLLPDIEAHNQIIESGADTTLTYIDPQQAINELNNIAGKEYDNRVRAMYDISLFLPQMDDYQAWEKILGYFTDNSVYLAPEGGFSTGMAIDRYEKEFEYAYGEPGTYTATVIATNVSEKNYKGDGLISDGTSSASDYDFARKIKTVTITVN